MSSGTAIPASAIIFITILGAALAVTIVVAFAKYWRSPEDVDNEGYGMRPPGRQQEEYMREVRRRGLGSWRPGGGGRRQPPSSRPSYGYNGGYGGGNGNSIEEEAGYPTYPPKSAGGSGYSNGYGYGNAYGDASAKRYSSGMPTPMTEGYTPPSAGSGGGYYTEDVPASIPPGAEPGEYFNYARQGNEYVEGPPDTKVAPPYQV